MQSRAVRAASRPSRWRAAGRRSRSRLARPPQQPPATAAARARQPSRCISMLPAPAAARPTPLAPPRPTPLARRAARVRRPDPFPCTLSPPSSHRARDRPSDAISPRVRSARDCDAPPRRARPTHTAGRAAPWPCPVRSRRPSRRAPPTPSRLAGPLRSGQRQREEVREERAGGRARRSRRRAPRRGAGSSAHRVSPTASRRSRRRSPTPRSRPAPAPPPFLLQRESWKRGAAVGGGVSGGRRERRGVAGSSARRLPSLDTTPIAPSAARSAIEPPSSSSRSFFPRAGWRLCSCDRDVAANERERSDGTL